MRRLRILTWASRPDYLRCLAQTPHELIVVSPGGREARGQKLGLLEAPVVVRQDVDGVLVGAASLTAESFVPIIEAAMLAHAVHAAAA